MNNTPARIFLNGVEQHHVRDYSTSEGWLIKRKQRPDGSVVVDPKTRHFQTERLEGEVVAIGDDRFVGVEVEYSKPVKGGAPTGADACKHRIVIETEGSMAKIVSVDAV